MKQKGEMDRGELISANGFYLFARRRTQLSLLIIPELKVLGNSFTVDTIEIFRTFRGDGKKIRHDQTNVSASLFDDALVLKEIFLTPEFGISVVTDPDLARFEFAKSSLPEFAKSFEFTTTNGISMQPHCYFTTHEQR